MESEWSSVNCRQYKTPLILVSSCNYCLWRRPAPKGQRVLCRIMRDKNTADKVVFPTYFLKVEKPVRGGMELVFCGQLLWGLWWL